MSQSHDSSASVEYAGKTASGRDRWRIYRYGTVKKIIVSKSSMAAIDDAMIRYADVLKRLAAR